MSSSHCGVIGCGNSYKKCPPGTRFYNIPSEARFPGRKQLWIDAITEGCRSSNGYVNEWFLKKRARICSQHFIGGVKSDHPFTPNYIPRIFYKKCVGFENYELIDVKRELEGNKEAQLKSVKTEMDQDSNDLPKTVSIGVNCCIKEESLGCQSLSQNVPILFCSIGIAGASTQTNIPHRKRKELSVQTDQNKF